jgi:hypothetical protein
MLLYDMRIMNRYILSLVLIKYYVNCRFYFITYN